MVTRIIGQTLLRIFEFYASPPRRFIDRFGLILLVCLLIGLASGALVTWLGWQLALLPDVYANDFYMVFFQGMLGENHYTFILFTELALGLFAVRLWRSSASALAEHSFRKVWGSITSANWSMFCGCLIGLVVLKLLLFNPVFDLTGVRDEFLDGFDDHVGHRKYRFLQYLNSVFSEALSWVPVGMSVLLLHKEARIPVKGEAARKALRIWGAIALMNFLIVSMEWAVIDYVKRFLIPLFSIPFESSFIPVAFNVLLIMLIGGLLLPAHLLCLTVPFVEWAGKGLIVEHVGGDPEHDGATTINLNSPST